MPAQKKVWQFDGRVSQYPSVFVNGSVHHGRGCTDCHGGADGRSTRAEAHAGMNAIPGSDRCASCHAPIVAKAAQSLHSDIGGFYPVLAARGFDFADPVAKARFDTQCAKCHTANAQQQLACGQCHLSVPKTAGGGLVAGHQFRRRPSMDNNCTACHGSRVKDEYYGLNGELLHRNQAAFPAGSPWKETQLAPDVHKAAGKDCAFCHASGEMHGEGVQPGGDRYAVTGTRGCVDCHTPSQSVFLHMVPKHLEAMSCHVCHSQPYKNCFDCHTDVTNGGLGYFSINGGDPTRATRTVAGQKPPAGDALMTFRVGRNPRPDRPEKYAVLRHVPVDRDVFTYSGTYVDAAGVSHPTEAPAPGLIPGMASQPTWKYATPHNIQRVTPIQSSCDNCHGAGHASFWLTDPVADALGWIPAAYEADERAANAGVVQPTPLPTR